jgi:hypothetical protein
MLRGRRWNVLDDEMEAGALIDAERRMPRKEFHQRHDLVFIPQLQVNAVAVRQSTDGISMWAVGDRIAERLSASDHNGFGGHGVRHMPREASEVLLYAVA